MIGSTAGKEPDFVQDEDLRSPEQLRGDMKAINKAQMSLIEKASVEGLRTEIVVLKQQLKKTHVQMQSLIGLYGTLRNEFDAFQAQRLKELTMKVNNGPTSTED